MRGYRYCFNLLGGLRLLNLKSLASVTILKSKIILLTYSQNGNEYLD